MAESVSEKSTKSQILEAYNDAMKKLKEAKQEDRRTEKKKEEEIETVKHASGNSIDRIIGEISDAKVKVMNELDDIGEKLTTEFKKFNETKKAVEIESKYLDDVYEIKTNADTLSALLLAQREKKSLFEAEMDEKQAGFDAEMNQKRLQSKQEQESYEKSKRERIEADRKEREREVEEYNYNVALERKKDEDAYAAKKAQMEKELLQKKEGMTKDLDEREAVISAKEKEYAELKAKVEQFPLQMESATKQAEKAVTEKIELNYKHEVELTQREIEGERKLNKQIIQSLENKIKEQADLIRQLTEKADAAGKQVQMIAVKAIEGASTQRAIAFEKAAEQTRTKENS